MNGRHTRTVILVAAFAALMILTTAVIPAGASTGQGGGSNGRCHAGAPGVGDDYYPLYGNGGYDVAHYLLKISYNPATDRLVGVATITARATETLCRFNLDLQGLTVRSVVVDGRKARWARSQDHELTVTPRHGLEKGRRFTTVVRYDGVPRTQIDLSVPEEPLPYGWIHTDDGAVVVSEPEGSANWFPLNDHPTDKAAFTFVVTVPAGLEAISNGRLVGRRTHDHRTTWVWTRRTRWRPIWPRPRSGSSTCAGTGPRTGCGCTTRSTPTCTTSRPTPRTRHRRPSGRSRTARWPARASSSISCRSSSGLTRSPPAGGSWTTPQICSSPWRPRPARSIQGPSSPTRSIGDLFVVHESAQWFGDSVALAEWKHMWLNEGFATYAEWLWGEREGLGTTQEVFDFFYDDIPGGTRSGTW